MKFQNVMPISGAMCCSSSTKLKRRLTVEGSQLIANNHCTYIKAASKWEDCSSQTWCRLRMKSPLIHCTVLFIRDYNTQRYRLTAFVINIETLTIFGQFSRKIHFVSITCLSFHLSYFVSKLRIIGDYEKLFCISIFQLVYFSNEVFSIIFIN